MNLQVETINSNMSEEETASNTNIPPEWDSQSEEVLNEVDPSSLEGLMLSTSINSNIPDTKLTSIKRVQNYELWTIYSSFRDNRVIPNSNQSNNNPGNYEKLLFHGTRDKNANQILNEQDGLDPRFSTYGLYGKGTYLAENPIYIVGKYAHRLPVDETSTVQKYQVLVVRTAIGVPQELGLEVSSVTRAMNIPGIRVEGNPTIRYGCVRAGPHSPSRSGPGPNASIIYSVYDVRQMYISHVIEFELPKPINTGTPTGTSNGTSTGTSVSSSSTAFGSTIFGSNSRSPTTGFPTTGFPTSRPLLSSNLLNSPSLVLTEPYLIPINHHSRFRNNLKIGDNIDAIDYEKKWFEASIVEADNDKVKVHYYGWSSSHDKWHKRQSFTIQPFRSKADWRKKLAPGSMIEYSIENNRWMKGEIIGYEMTSKKVLIKRIGTNHDDLKESIYSENICKLGTHLRNQKSRECFIDNDNPTINNMKMALREYGLRRSYRLKADYLKACKEENIIFINSYDCFFTLYGL